MELDQLGADNERVKPIIVDSYEHIESGLKLKLREMTLYLLNEDDFEITPAEFHAEKHEHAIPKFEMARIYILVCAMTGDKLGFSPSDRDTDGAYEIYERAYQKLVRTATDRSLFLGIARVGQDNGFLTEGQAKAMH
ncbi:MAG: hypothetical protein EOP10_28875 [Proteobacteria bacterium]|nr:MAG: hypothetical protein EOP10_28875 [Pseudomonadota bacterium]